MNDIAQIGNWTTEESEYILALMKEFKAGTLPIAKGTTLRKFLSRELGCNVNQITKKFKGTSYDARSKYSGSLSSSKSPIEDRLRLDQLDMLKKRYQDGQKDAPVAPKTTKKAARVIASVQHISQHAKAPPMTTEITVAVMPVEQSPAMAAGQRTLQDIDWLALAGGQALQALNNHQASPLSTGLSGGLKQQQQSSAPAASVTYASLTATVAPTRDNWQQQTQQTLSFGNVNSAPSSNEWAQALLGYGQQQQSSSAASLYNNAVEQALLERYGHSDSQPSHAASLYSAQSNNEVTQALLERYGHSDSQPSHGASLYSAQSNNAVAQALQGYGYGNPQSSIASSMYSTPSDSAVAQALLGYGYSAPQPSTASSLYGTQSNNAVAQALLGHSDQNTASAYMSLDPNVFAYLTQAPY